MTARRGSSPFLDTSIIGGKGGSWFNFDAKNGAMLEKIGVHCKSKNVILTQ